MDEFRESPSLEIASLLSRKYPGEVVCVDPFADALPPAEKVRRGLSFCDIDAALRDAGVLVMLVPHAAFHSFPRPEKAVIVDPVGFWR